MIAVRTGQRRPPSAKSTERGGRAGDANDFGGGFRGAVPLCGLRYRLCLSFVRASDRVSEICDSKRETGACSINALEWTIQSRKCLIANALIEPGSPRHVRQPLDTLESAEPSADEAFDTAPPSTRATRLTDRVRLRVREPARARDPG